MGVSFNKSGIILASGDVIRPNIFKNSDFSQQVTNFTTWNTEKNGTHYANYWDGYNGGVANAATCYHAHLVQFQGEWVYEYTRESETWLGVNQGGLQTIIQPNTTYTWSIDEYRPTGANNYITAGLYYKETSDGANGFHAGCPHGDGLNIFDKWVRRKYTFTVGSIYTGAGVRFYIYGQSGGTGTIYMRRPKLELGDTATPWTHTTAEGYVESSNGFIEAGDSMKVFDSYIETTEFIEY